MTEKTTAPDGAIIKASIESVQTAVAGFDKIAAGLAELEAAHPLDVVCEVSTPAGMRQAIASRAAWRDPRIATEKARKEAKAPVLALGKQIDAFAAGLEARLRLGEEHYDAQIKAEEERKEKARQERAAAEARRIAAHQDRIRSDITMAVAGAANAPSSKVAIFIADIEAMSIGPEFEEFREQAAAAKAETLTKLRELHAAAVAREAEAARIAAERAELERLRAEQAERERIERERVAAEQKAEAERLAAERAELERQKAEARAEQARIDAESAAARRAADEKAAAERAEADRVAREAREAEERRIAAAQAELRRQQEEAAAAQRQKDAEAAEARRAAQAAEERVRKAAPQMLDALRAVAASGGWGYLEEHVQGAVSEAISAAGVAILEAEVPY